jgi:hypothetical protein
LIPLVGGSGGGGTQDGGNPGQAGQGGGGGGGAILLASSTKFDITGTIQCRGGRANCHNMGSGGAIRIVAPVLAGGGTARIIVEGGNNLGGCPGAGDGGDGRVRIDTPSRTPAPYVVQPANVFTQGTFMVVFPPNLPTLRIVEAAGQAIAEDAQGPVNVFLPFGSSPSRTVKVRATNFAGIVKVVVVLTPEHGDRQVYPAEIQMGSSTTADATVNIELPINTATRIHVWTS